MALTKAEMSEHLFEKLGLSKRDAKDLVELFFEEVRRALENGEKPGRKRQPERVSDVTSKKAACAAFFFSGTKFSLFLILKATIKFVR
jgi:hypothetical protein